MGSATSLTVYIFSTPFDSLNRVSDSAVFGATVPAAVAFPNAIALARVRLEKNARPWSGAGLKEM